MTLRLSWPQSLAGRTLLVLLATALVVYLGGVVVYQLLAQEAAARSRIVQIADRLDTAMVALAELPAGDRADAARALSSASFRITWNPRSLVDDASADDPDLQALRRELVELVPQLSGRSIHLRWDEHGFPGTRNVLLGAAQLKDASYLVFSAALVPTIIPLLPNAMFVATFVFLSIVAIAFFVLRTINAPLRRLAEAADRYGHYDPVVLPECGPREIVQVERAFNAMQRRIRRLIADRTQALAAVSHDLRTPISRLRLRCSLLTDSAVRAECERDLAEMEAMVEATLAYLRGDDDVEQPKLTNVASTLATLVDAAVDEGHDASLSGPRHVVLMLRGISVKRALANLIDNAISYGECARVMLQQRPGEIVVLIDDDGPGIAEADIPQVFEPFSRLEASRNRGTGGVGLGLTIARQVIEREGGRIRLMNRPEGGLRAEVRLPVRTT